MGELGLSFRSQTQVFLVFTTWVQPALPHIRTGLTSKRGWLGDSRFWNQKQRQKKSSPRSTAATLGMEGREGAPQLEETSHKLMESHTSLVRGAGWAVSPSGRLSTVGESGSKDTQHHVGGMLVRLPCYSKCGFRTSSISCKTVRNTEPQALPDHLNQNPTLINIHRRFLCTFESESHCISRWLDPSH